MDLAARVAAGFARLVTAINAVDAKIAARADPWTRKTLASDFSNSTVTFNNITDGTTTFTYTPPANSNFLIEFELLLSTATTTTLPLPGVSIAAGQSYGAVSIEYQSGAAARIFTEGWFTTIAATVKVLAGTAPAATPYLAKGVIKGRSGATPGAIVLQLASEVAGGACLVRQGSEMRYRTIP